MSEANDLIPAAPTPPPLTEREPSPRGRAPTSSGAEVVTYTGDVGQWESDLERARRSAVLHRRQLDARLKLYKGQAMVEGRRSKSHALYDEATVTFEADDVYDQANASGFIRLRALRLRTLAAKRISEGE